MAERPYIPEIYIFDKNVDVFNIIPPSLRVGLTDEEVDLAIQRSGSKEEPLTVAVPGPVHIAHPVPLAPYSEYYHIHFY